MKKLLALLFVGFLVTACNEAKDLRQVVITKEQIILEIPEAFNNCPRLRTFPDPAKLTDKQVANLLITLVANNQKCADSIDKIYAYVKKARAAQSKNK